MPDSDYLIRSFKKNMLKKSDEKDEQKSLILSPQQDNSNTFKATISLPLNLYDFFKPKTKARNFSNIFNGKYFYL